MDRRSVIIGPGVVVSPDVAAELALFANAGRDRVRSRDGFRMSPPCEQVLAELQALKRAGAHLAITTPDLATTSSPSGSPCTVDTVTVTEFAKQREISTAAVTDRCRRGTLPATKVDGIWRIYTEGEFE